MRPSNRHGTGEKPLSHAPSSEMFDNSILVVAHPDDEILWFSSVAARVDEILFCFNDYPALPALGEGRRRVLDDYPLPCASTLGIEESGSFSGADWKRPIASPYGLEIVHGRKIRQRYQENYRLLEEKLGERLHSYTNVFTHNPWGEYGHEDHVQVYRAIDALRQQFSFRVWCSNYASNRSLPLLLDHFTGFDTAYHRLPTDPELADTLKALYQRHRCWTWYRDYRWFDQECFLEATHLAAGPREGAGQRFPVNLIKIDFPDKPGKPLAWPIRLKSGFLTRSKKRKP